MGNDGAGTLVVPHHRLYNELASEPFDEFLVHTTSSVFGEREVAHVRLFERTLVEDDPDRQRIA